MDHGTFFHLEFIYRHAKWREASSAKTQYSGREKEWKWSKLNLIMVKIKPGERKKQMDNDKI